MNYIFSCNCSSGLILVVSFYFHFWETVHCKLAHSFVICILGHLMKIFWYEWSVSEKYPSQSTVAGPPARSWSICTSRLSCHPMLPCGLNFFDDGAMIFYDIEGKVSVPTLLIDSGNTALVFERYTSRVSRHGRTEGPASVVTENLLS